MLAAREAMGAVAVAEARLAEPDFGLTQPGGGSDDRTDQIEDVEDDDPTATRAIVSECGRARAAS